MKKTMTFALAFAAAVGIATSLNLSSIEPNPVTITDVQAAVTDTQTYKNTIYINYTPGYGIAVYDAPDGNLIADKKLEDGTKWKTFEAAQTDTGAVWYNLGGAQWIPAKYAAPYRVVKMTDVATIKYAEGYGIAVWTNPEATPYSPHNFIDGKKLETGTNWKVLEKATATDGTIWYNLGGAQWIQAEYTTLESQTEKTGWPFAKAYTTGNYENGQQFGETSYDRGGSPDPYFHDGFDFGSAIYGEGSTIKAITAGKVIYAGSYGYGLNDVIVIQANDGYQIMYQEFSKSVSDIHVSVGETVTLGQSIGKLTASHLHVGVTSQNWETSLAYAFNSKGPWINPITYIQKGL